jgi:hypothetical protein
MVDRVYKGGIPELKKALEKLRKEFSGLHSRTDWVHLRVDPVLKHSSELERLVTSRRFSKEFSRLTEGVVLFHSDLVYLRANVKELQKILETEKARHSG